MTDITPREGHSHDTEAKPGHSPVADVPHRLRLTDTDPKAARRAERQVTSMFLLSMLFTVLFVVAYVAIDKSTTIYIPVMGDVGASQVALGFTLGAAVFLIGAMVLFPIPLVVLLKDLWVPTPEEQGKSPAEILSTTLWTTDTRIVSDGTYAPVKPEDMPVGGLISAVPEDLLEVEELQGNLNARGKAAIILVRMAPDEIRSQQGEGWDYQGIVAYSKICTHVGCPIALYEQRTHHLLCPCHQSTFDLADSGEVVFGPAARRMPQLPIGVDEEGYLVAKSDFAEPVGPSFWERG